MSDEITVTIPTDVATTLTCTILAILMKSTTLSQEDRDHLFEASGILAKALMP